MVTLAQGCRADYKGPVKVTIHAWPPDRRRRDLDNILKATLDALEHAKIYENDSQVHDLRIRRMTPFKGGKILVMVTEL